MNAKQPAAQKKPHRPFRRAVFRGLAMVMPPLLTILLLLWVWSAVQTYVLNPFESGASHVIAWYLNQDPTKSTQQRPFRDEQGRLSVMHNGESYIQLKDGQWVLKEAFDAVQDNPGDPKPRTAHDYYCRYAELEILKPSVVLPIFLCLFVLVLYFLGKFMAAGAGRIAWVTLEMAINQLPVVRNIYSSVKQVSDFVFSEREVGFTRVVAVQYPRRGIWTVAFVTGESMIDVRSAANEPVLSLLIPTSPMPATGFTITALKSETIDLDITIDQAIQFVVSCGVVVPPQQLYQESTVGGRLADAIGKAAPGGLPAPSDNGDQNDQPRKPGDPAGQQRDEPPEDVEPS